MDSIYERIQYAVDTLEVFPSLRQWCIAAGYNPNYLSAAFDRVAKALRLGEVDGHSMAIVTPHRTYARGKLVHASPSDLTHWAAYGHPNIRRAVLRDDPRRTLLKQAK